MPGYKFMLSKHVSPQEAFEYLKLNLRSPKITGITFDSDMSRIDIAANYYSYQVSFIGSQMTITPKIVQKWLIIMLICILVGIVLFVPWAIAVVIAILMNLEAKEIKTLVSQTLNMMQTQQFQQD